MERRKFSRKFKLEAVKLVRDRGVAVTSTARGMDLHENVLRKLIREAEADPRSAFQATVSDTMTAQLVTDALMMAIWRRGKPDALLHHSDQGVATTG